MKLAISQYICKLFSLSNPLCTDTQCCEGERDNSKDISHVVWRICCQTNPTQYAHGLSL